MGLIGWLRAKVAMLTAFCQVCGGPATSRGLCDRKECEVEWLNATAY
jgi:hypothetical protein